MSKKQNAVWKHTILVLFITLALTTCNVFKAGLGTKIDIASPSVAVSSIANGAYLRGTVTLTGDDSDDIGVKSVEVIVTINSTQVASIPATIANGTWSAALDTKALSGGLEVQANLDIRATDNSGKTSDQMLVVYFDNVAPVITSLNPSEANLANSAFALSETTTVSGSVKDGLGLAKTVLTVGDITLADTSHPAAWSMLLDTTKFYDGSGTAINGATKLGSGLYSVPYTVVATDHAGNTSATLSDTLYINPDGAPIIDVTGLTSSVSNMSKIYPNTTPAVSSNIIPPGATFKFRVSDLDGIDTSTLYVALALGSDNAGHLTAAPTDLPHATIFKVGDATYPLIETILDSTTLPGGSTVPTRADYSFTAPAATGEFMLLIHAADVAANKINKSTGASPGTAAERYLPNAPASGSYTYTSLFVTNSTTNVSLDTPADGSYSSATVSASGTATSDDTLSGVTITITNKATSAVVDSHLVDLSALSTKSTPWSYSKSGLLDGSYSIAAVATNVMGKTSDAATRSFIVDTALPSVTLINDINGLGGGSVGISGTATDATSGVAKVEYQLDSTTGTWTTAVGTASWSGNIDLSPGTIAEGPHALKARATDVAGNVSAVASKSFEVDKASPEATETNHGPALIQSKTNVAFAGIADDAAITLGRIASGVTLSLSKDGGTATTTTLSATGSSGGLSWNQTTGAWSYTLLASSGDGLYTLSLTATDVASKTATVARTVQIDTTAPTLVVSAPVDNESTSNSNYTISGTSRDTGGVGFSGTNDVEYSSDGGANWSALTLTGTSWSKTLDLGSTEGARTLMLRSTDKLGNQAASGTINYFYDLNPPTMAETGVGGVGNPASYSMSTNAAISFSGMESDTDALASSGFLKVAIDGAAAVDLSSLTAGPYTNTISGGAASKTWQLNATVGSGGLADGVHTFVFTAKDIAGKTTSVTRTATVDTTKPASAITTPANLPSSNTAYWLSGSTAGFLGTSSDSGAGASGVASVYYTIVAKGAGMPAFSTSTWSLAAGTTSWNATVTLSTEGQFTLYVAAVDAVGNVEAPISRDFGVDQSAPTVSETHSATFAEKTLYTLSGTIADTNALASLTVTEKKGAAAPSAVTLSAPATVTGTSEGWTSVSLPLGATGATLAAHSNDGSYTYTMTVTDVAGKTTTLTRTVNIDTTPPNVTLNAPPSWVSGTALTIGGGATDSASGASGVATVSYKLDGAASWTNAAWTDTSGGGNATGTWNATLTGLAEGNHTLEIIATDAAANTTVTSVTGSFGVDLNAPNLSETALNTASQVIKNSSFTMTGSVSDTNPLSIANSTLTVGVSVNGGAATAATITGTIWSYTQALVDGSYSYTITATDAAGKTTTLTRLVLLDSTPPTFTVTSPSSGGWVSTTSLSATGVASDGAGSGVSTVYLKADGLYVAATSTDHSAEDPVASGWTAVTGTSWSASLTLSGEGRKTLWIKALDAAGNITSTAGAVFSRVDFGLDLNPPALGFTDSVATLVNSSFTLAGTTTDTNAAGLPTQAVTVDGGSSQSVTVTSGTWTFPVSVDASGHANDGSHTYVFTATDIAGKTTTLSRTITVDTTLPSTSISQPGSYTSAQPQYWLSGSTASLGGSAADSGPSASGVAKVYYKVDSILTSHAADTGATIVGTWTLAAGTTTWSATVNLGTIGEGQFTLWTAAYDNAGNLSAITSRSFGVDQSAPSLTETNHASLSYTNAGYTLNGAIGDTNSLVSLAITESKDGGTVNSVAFTPSTALDGAQSATYTSASLPLGGLADGSYAYVLTATDIAGKTTVVNRTVKVDTTAPTVALAAIPAWVSSSAYAISGTAADPNTVASGVSAVSYKLDGAAAWTDATWVDGSGNNTSGTWSATLSGLTEGNHSVVVKVTDAASNATTLGASTFGVDLSAPSLDETALNTTSQVIKKSSFTMTGSVSDTNPLSAANSTLTVSVSVNGGTASPVTITGTTWSYTQASVDGSYSYTITATDAAGKTTVLNRLVLLDSTPPSLTVTSPTPGSWTSSSTLSVAGTAFDGSGAGVLNVYYLVDGAANDHSSDIAAWCATSGTAAPSSGTSATWAAATGASSWSGSGSLSAEGFKYLWVVASDKAGNTTSLVKAAAGSFATGGTYTIAAVGTTDFVALGASSNAVGVSFLASGAGSGSGEAWAGTGKGVTFSYDLAAPTLTETTVNTTDTQYVKADLSFGGAASDTNELSSLKVSVNSGAATAISVNAGDHSWSYSFPAGASAEGSYSLVFTATDVAGKTTVLSRTVVVDKTLPTVAGITSLAGWKIQSSLGVSGTASDAGSGIDHIEYKVGAGSWSNFTGTSSFTGSVAFSEGGNTLLIRAMDKAGNYSVPAAADNSQQTVQVDTNDPTIEVTNPTTSPVMNGSVDLGITVSAEDVSTGSGLASIAAYTYDSSTSTSGTVRTVAASGSSASVSLNIPAADILALTAGNRKIYVKAIDVAGRSSSLATINLVVDKTPPTVTFDSHANGATVNKLIKLSGTSSDANGVASCVVQVYNVTSASWTAAPSGVSDGSTSWSLTDFDTSAITAANAAPATLGCYDSDTSTAGLQLKLRALATDAAGNTATVERTLLVDQDSDKPVIKLTNLATTGTPTLKQTTTIYGSITDDDGTVLSLHMKNAPGDAWVAVTLDGQSFSYTVTGSDGDKTLYFQIEDAGLSTFETTATSTGLSPRLYQAPSTYLETPLTFKLDTTNPDLNSDSLGIKLSGASSYSPYSASTAYYGGSSTGSFYVQYMASDANSVASGSVTVTDSASVTKTATATLGASVALTANAGTDTFTSVSSHGLSAGDRVYFTATTLPTGLAANTPYYVLSSGLTSTAFQVSASAGGTAVDIATSGSGLNFTTGWTTTTALDVSTLASGSATLSMMATDSSGLTSTVSKVITIDNVAPTFGGISSPASGSVVNGNVTLNGSCNDTGVGLASVSYQLGNTANPTTGTWIPVGGTSLYAWQLTLNSDTYANTTDSTYDSVNETYHFPIIFKITDKAGNSTVTSAGGYFLTINPNADRPTVTITYPSASDSPLGGSVRVYGTATDDDAVYAVYMQIDADGNGSYDSNDVIGGTDWYAGGLGQLVDGTYNWSKKINSSGEFSPQSVSADPVADTFTTTSPHGLAVGNWLYFSGASMPGGLSPATKYYVVSVPTTTTFAVSATSGGPTLDITSAGANVIAERALSSTIHVRVRALDKDGNTSGTPAAVYGPWVETTITFDNNTPKIGSSLNLCLTQGATTNVYSEGMYVSGDWLFGGSVEDETSLQEITVESDGESAIALSADIKVDSAGNLSGTNTGWVTTHTPITRYDLAIPLNTSGLGAKSGTIKFTIKATDYTNKTATSSVTIYFDNKAPFTALSTTGPIVNSNGYFDIAGTATDVGSSITKIEVYFVRPHLAGQTVDGSQYMGYDRFYNPATGASSGDIAGANAGIIAVDGSVYGPGGTGAATTGTFYYPSNSAYIISVDHLGYTEYLSGGVIQNSDGDPFVESLILSAGSYAWSGSFDSSLMPDGPIQVHYVVYDKAGNKTHYELDTMISNRALSVSSVTLGTDLNGVGGVTPDEQTTYTSWTSTGFVFKATPATFDIVPSGGNGSLYYALSASDGTHTLTQSGLLRSGSGGTPLQISLAAAKFSGFDDCATTFTIAVYDSTEESSYGNADPTKACRSQNLGIGATVDMVDSVPPKATIAPFYWHSASSNSLYLNSTANGHVEVASVVGGAGPDISGKVKVEGSAYDDQQISAIYLQIDGMPFTGNLGTASYLNESGVSTMYYKVAGYAGGAWTNSGIDLANGGTNGWYFTASTSSLTQAGHAAAWELDWDTSKIGTVAATNAVIRMAIVDKGGNVSLRTLDSSSSVNAGSFVAGTAYTITSVGSTSFTSIGASANTVGIIFVATGAGSGTGTASTIGNAPYYTVDVVPYIKSIGRLSPYATTRSREGRYVLRRGETVTLTGFNMYYSGHTSLQIGGADASSSIASATTEGFTATVPVTASSGTVDFSVYGMSEPNNLTTANAEEYQKEATSSSATDGSALWTDDRKVFIWISDSNATTANFGYFAGSGYAIHPAMTYAPSGANVGRLYASWSNYSASSSYYNSNASATATTIINSLDPPEHTDIAWNTTLAGPVVAYNENMSSLGNFSIANSGGVQLYASNAPTNTTLTNTTAKFNRLEELYHDAMLMQFVNERVASSATGHFVTYYDTETKALKYGFVPYNSQATAELTDWVNVDGGADSDDTYLANATKITYTGAASTVASLNYSDGSSVAAGATIMTIGSTAITNTTGSAGYVTYLVSVGQSVGPSSGRDGSGNTVNNYPAVAVISPSSTLNRSKAAGEYSAIALNPNGYPVIAYYSASDQTLKIAHANYAAATSAANYTRWKIQYAMSSGVYSGKYVSAKIDATGYLYLAFYNTSSGDLMYLKSTNAPTDGTTDYTFDSPQVIDSIGSVGVGADITLNGTSTPYVSYYDGSNFDTFNGLKMAYYDTANSMWEYMNVPLAFNVASDDRTSAEYNTGETPAVNLASTNLSCWTAAVGYKSDDYYRIAYLTPGY